MSTVELVEKLKTCDDWEAADKLLAQYVAQQSAAKDAAIAELQSQASLLRAGLRSAHASGILEAAKKAREYAEFDAKPGTAGFTLGNLATALESLASKHPQPTAGQEVEVQRNTAEELYAMAQREAVDLRATVAQLEADKTMLLTHEKRLEDVVADLERELAAVRAERFDVDTIFEWATREKGLTFAVKQRGRVLTQLQAIATNRGSKS